MCHSVSQAPGIYDYIFAVSIIFSYNESKHILYSRSSYKYSGKEQQQETDAEKQRLDIEIFDNLQYAVKTRPWKTVEKIVLALFVNWCFTFILLNISVVMNPPVLQ